MIKSALLENSKTAGVPGLCFETALNCTSNALGLCNAGRHCYAVRDSNRNPDVDKNYKRAADALNYLIDNNKLDLLSSYFKIYDIKLVRLNLAGDFRTDQDVQTIRDLAAATPGTVFYGYTCRRDLDLSDRPSNFVLNGSGYMLDNSFNIIYDIETYYHADIKCAGHCSTCRNCCSKKGLNISCFIHNAPNFIQKILKKEKNYKFLNDLIYNKLDVKLTPDHFKKGGMFIKSYNVALNRADIETPVGRDGKYTIKTVPDLLKFIEYKALLLDGDL